MIYYSNKSNLFRTLAHFTKALDLKCCLSWSFKNDIPFIELPIVLTKSLTDIIKKCGLSLSSIKHHTKKWCWQLIMSLGLWSMAYVFFDFPSLYSTLDDLTCIVLNLVLYLVFPQLQTKLIIFTSLRHLSQVGMLVKCSEPEALHFLHFVMFPSY